MGGAAAASQQRRTTLVSSIFISKGGHMSNKSLPIVSIILYLLAGLFFIYAIWSAVNASQIISDAINANQLVVRGSEFEIVSFFMSSVGQFIVYAAVLFGLGRILHVVSPDDLEDIDEEDELTVVVTEPVEDEEPVEDITS
jgi:hypothetical protein